MVGNNSNLEIFNRIKETNSNNADEYSNSKTYVKDEYCIYNNTLYKANQAIDTAEEFTESHWTETTVGTELKSQADSISALNSRITYKCIIDSIQLTNVPAGYSEPDITLSPVTGVLVAMVVQLISFSTGGQITISAPGSNKLWVVSEVAQSVINLRVLRFYTDS